MEKNVKARNVATATATVKERSNQFVRAKKELESGNNLVAFFIIVNSRIFTMIKNEASKLCEALGLPEYEGLKISVSDIIDAGLIEIMSNLKRLEKTARYKEAVAYLFKGAKGAMVDAFVDYSKAKYPDVNKHIQDALIQAHKTELERNKEISLASPISDFFVEDVQELILERRKNWKDNNFSIYRVEKLMSCYSSEPLAYKDIRNKSTVAATLEAFKKYSLKCENVLKRKNVSAEYKKKLSEALAEAKGKIAAYLIDEAEKNEKATAAMLARRNRRTVSSLIKELKR